MYMAKALGFSDVLEKLLVVTQAVLFVVQCELPPYEDLIRTFREMHTIPRLKTHGGWQSVDVLHGNVLFRAIVDMSSSLQFT
jgi:hypothetical protein